MRTVKQDVNRAIHFIILIIATIIIASIMTIGNATERRDDERGNDPNINIDNRDSLSNYNKLSNEVDIDMSQKMYNNTLNQSGAAAGAWSNSEGGTSYVGGYSNTTTQSGNSNDITFKQAVQAPGLGLMYGYVSQSDDMCTKSAGGSGSGSDGLFAAGLSVLFGVDDDFCKHMKRVKFLLTTNQPFLACQYLVNYDRKEDDGIFADTIGQAGGCGVIALPPKKVVAAPVVIVPPHSNLKQPNWKAMQNMTDANIDRLHTEAVSK